MANTPCTPLQDTQMAASTVEPACDLSPHARDLLEAGISTWVSFTQGTLDQDKIRLIMELGVDEICTLSDTIGAIGTRSARRYVESLKRLPEEDCSAFLDKVCDSLPEEDGPRSSRSFKTPTKRKLIEVLTPSTDNTNSTSRTSSSNHKRVKNTQSPNGSGSSQEFYCPGCPRHMKTKVRIHLRECLLELRNASENALIGCGYCHIDRCNKFHGKAYRRDDYIEHVVENHRKGRSGRGYDINSAINNTLTHENFIGDFEELRRKRNAQDTSSTPLAWTQSDKDQSLLHELQELGGRLQEAYPNNATPSISDQKRLNKLLEKAYAYALRPQEGSSTQSIPPPHENQSSFDEFTFDDFSRLEPTSESAMQIEYLGIASPTPAPRFTTYNANVVASASGGHGT